VSAEETDASEVESAEDEETLQDVALPSGEALTLAESRELTLARETSLVVVAGSPDSGKTTLVASIFHCFQRGPFAGYIFAGSNTSVGLDRRCHLGRTISRGIAPNMERTQVGAPQRFIHFRVRREDLSEASRDILITDISGEEYEDLRHSMPECREFPLFRRADHIVVLVDGDRLANPADKNAAKFETMQFLGFLRDAGHFERRCNVHVLIAKCDLLAKPSAQRFAAQLKSDITLKFSKCTRNLYVGDIAARPQQETTDYPLGHGMSIPFASWLERPQERTDLAYCFSAQNCHSEFDKLLMRTDSLLSVRSV
jgi:hypothetical protein